MVLTTLLFLAVGQKSELPAELKFRDYAAKLSKFSVKYSVLVGGTKMASGEMFVDRQQGVSFNLEGARVRYRYWQTQENKTEINYLTKIFDREMTLRIPSLPESRVVSYPSNISPFPYFYKALREGIHPKIVFKLVSEDANSYKILTTPLSPAVDFRMTFKIEKWTGRILSFSCPNEDGIDTTYLFEAPVSRDVTKELYNSSIPDGFMPFSLPYDYPGFAVRAKFTADIRADGKQTTLSKMAGPMGSIVVLTNSTWLARNDFQNYLKQLEQVASELRLATILVHDGSGPKSAKMVELVDPRQLRRILTGGSPLTFAVSRDDFLFFAQQGFNAKLAKITPKALRTQFSQLEGYRPK